MSEIAGDRPDVARPAEGKRMTARRRKPVRFVAIGVVAAAVVGVAVGFVSFARSVSEAVPPADPRAEGIVVLTGGAARIDGALALLAEGRAARLLISGVNPAVTRAKLAEIVSEDVRQVLRCCVDVDHARDTIENASSTRRWVEKQGFRSLIVVTSDYHMPRSMAELESAMPDVRLISFPVSNPDLHLGDWWRNSEVFGLLAREYGKFLLAEARQFLPPGHPARAAGL